MTEDVRFATLLPIGRGGMGSVEVAVDRSDASRPRVVALKRLLADIAKDKRHVEAFLREARLALLLTHPNIVRAHWVGEQDGQVMLAMDYVDGEPLSEVLRAGKLPAALASYVIAEVCEGLHAAHELRDVGGTPLNLVHRDVSPHNVMITYDGRVLVLDFGVAKIDSGAGLTRTGEVKGKAAYMSPEQGLGDPVDRRSDLYAVGAMLFECVAGRRMWLGETDMAVLKQLALSEPPRLSGEGIPAELSDLASRLVARDRDGRPASAHEVADSLRALAGPVTAADLAAHMRAHFGDNEREKHERLESALELREPAEADALRASLLPVEAGAKPAAPVAMANRPRRQWLVWAAIATAIALPSAFFLIREPARSPPPSPTEVSPPPASSVAPSPTPTPTPSPLPSPTRTTATPAIRSIPTRPSAAVPSASASSRTPDVDPHPF